MTCNKDSISNLTVKNKLPDEELHLDALNRMRTLKPYYKWTKSLFHNYIGQRILDAGCGIGNFSDLIAQDAEFVLAVDLSPENLLVLEERFKNHLNVKIAQYDLDSHIDIIRDHKLDTIVCLDVLEHIEDDMHLLENFRKLIQPQGKLLIKVPACPWLYGSIDKASGHFRRYTKTMLTEKLKKAGWTPQKVSYMNISGVLPYFIKSRIIRNNANFSRTFSKSQINILKFLMPLFKNIDYLVGPPIGQSLVVVAE